MISSELKCGVSRSILAMTRPPRMTTTWSLMARISGSSEELWRAARLGCRFSLGERSLATRRGREYARILPAELLLAETDLPETKGSTTGAAEVLAPLERTVSVVAAARGVSEEEVRRLFADNARALLDV